MTMTTRTAPATRRWFRRHPWRTPLIGVLALIVGAGGMFAWQLQASALPERLNMGTASSAHHHDGGTMSTGISPGASAPAVSTTGSVTSVTDLAAVPSDAPTKSFHLTA